MDNRTKAKIRRAETILSKMIDLKALEPDNLDLQDASRLINSYISKKRSK